MQCIYIHIHNAKKLIECRRRLNHLNHITLCITSQRFWQLPNIKYKVIMILYAEDRLLARREQDRSLSFITDGMEMQPLESTLFLQNNDSSEVSNRDLMMISQNFDRSLKLLQDRRSHLVCVDCPRSPVNQPLWLEDYSDSLWPSLRWFLFCCYMNKLFRFSIGFFVKNWSYHLNCEMLL